MGMVITNNINALNTQRWLNTNNTAMTTDLQNLSSGYRINTAADDPAGLVISEKLRAENVGLKRAVQNTEEASNVIGIAEGALTEMSSVLETMRELALHAANNGVTSSDEIEADQAEMDSAVETLDNIAATTKYSNEYLLNGNQSITYSDSLNITNSKDIKLLDSSLTKINQIGSSSSEINVSFVGASDSSEAKANLDINAQRAYIEASVATNGDTDYSASSGTLTVDQKFTISGNGGTQAFSFASGTSLGEIASTITNSSESTGVGCALVFDSVVTSTTASGTGFVSDANGNYSSTFNSSGQFSTPAAAYHAAGEALFFNQDSSGNLIANTDGVTNRGVAYALFSGVNAGDNSDENGSFYIKWTSATNAVVYKDSDLTYEVGRIAITNASTASFMASNESGLSMSNYFVTTGTMLAGDVTVIVGGQVATPDTGETTSTALGFEFTDTNTLSLSGALSSGSNYFGTTSAVSGVRLGENTDAEGSIYFKIVKSGTADVVIYAYNDSRMGDDSLICQSQTTALSTTGDRMVVLYDNDTGLGMYLNGTSSLASASSGTYTGTLSFANLGLRLYSTNYGEANFVKVAVSEGELFLNPDDSTENISAEDGEIVDYGQNAIINVNGQKVELNGTSGTFSASDVNADLVFYEGELGASTIATTGYDVGSIVSAIGEMSDKNNYCTQAIHSTSETLDNIQGGMTFQLGEGVGESIVYSIEAMTSSSLGETEVTKDFDGDGDKEAKTLTISDCRGGGYASLAADASITLNIIDNAIDDVSALRARLGATQSNLLETNANSLGVAIENITATESSIRDVDMALATTDYTKNSILVQSATSMLAQANSASQSVLTLIGAL